jgi:hypothetical protein
MFQVKRSMFHVLCSMFHVPYYVLVILGLALFSNIASAETISLKSAKTTYRVGDSFQVTLSINTDGKSINTIAGQVAVPTDKLQITDLRYGNSILTLWVDKPTIGSGLISFSGGVPGGYNGSNGPILNFTVKAKKTGSVTISLQDFQVLLNNGLGTAATNLTLGKLVLTINEALPPPPSPTVPKEEKPVEVYVPAADTVAPENFIPIVSHHPSVADNKFFVSFSAVDKDSGVAYYEVREEPWLLRLITDKFSSAWQKADSPYILRGQWWSYKVWVRAYDGAGNMTENFAIKPLHPYLVWLLIVLLVLATIFFTRYFFKPSRPLSPSRPSMPSKPSSGKRVKVNVV